MATNNDSARFTYPMFAVFHPTRHSREENTIQTYPHLIQQPVTMDASYGSPASTLFRFTAPLTDGTLLYVQVLPNRIESLARIPCDDPHDTPELDAVRNQLGTVRLVRLHFRLRESGDLIAPVSFEPDRLDPDSNSLHTLRSMTSLAATLDFSVYTRHTALTKSKFTAFHDAIRDSQDAAHVPALEWRADPSRLYNGKGGKVVSTEYASSTASYASTDAADSPPAYTIPPDEEKSTALPAYHQVDQHVAPPVKASKRARSSSGSVDTRPSKRSEPELSAPGISVSESLELRARQVQELGQELGAMLDARIHDLLAPYGTRIRKLEDTIRGLEAKNKHLEEQNTRQQHELVSLKEQLQEGGVSRMGMMEQSQVEFEQRQEDLEQKQAELEKRQDDGEQAAELADIRLDRLEDVLSEDWKGALVEEVRSEAVDKVVGESVDRIRDCLRNA
ncbi:hypothetical protein PG993_003714 [Apiospora rasikravindrae]|uniref:Uncharacterized protein n=1 Tax=Apiospora rasikravindrae TaxID=990691 RepID=A0ABR1U0B8_9PEZI